MTESESRQRYRRVCAEMRGMSDTYMMAYLEENHHALTSLEGDKWNLITLFSLMFNGLVDFSQEEPEKMADILVKCYYKFRDSYKEVAPFEELQD